MRNGTEREQRVRLWHRDDALLLSDTNTQFFGGSGPDSKRVKHHVKKASHYAREHRTEQQRQNKTCSQRGQIHLRPNRHETVTGNGAGQRVRSEEHTSELQSLTNLVC